MISTATFLLGFLVALLVVWVLAGYLQDKFKL